MSTASQYEFSEQENKNLRDLAGKMKFVGFFLAAFGAIALIICLLTVTFIFRDRLPSGFRENASSFLKQAQEKLPDDLKEKAANYSLDKVPTDNNFLTGVAIFTGIVGLIFLLQGLWTRSSAASFQKIVDVRGNDIGNLMNAVGSLQAMYGQVYLLLMIGLIAGVVSIGICVYQAYVA